MAEMLPDSCEATLLKRVESHFLAEFGFPFVFNEDSKICLTRFRPEQRWKHVFCNLYARGDGLEMLKLGTADFQEHPDGHLVFGIDLKVQNVKLYAYLLRLVLRSRPQVTSLKTGAMTFAGSQNARVFARSFRANQSAQSADQQLAWHTLRGSAPMDRIALRERILNAIASTPAMKVRRRLGFSDVQRVKIRRSFQRGDLEVELDVFRGDGTRIPRIFIELPTGTPIEILSNGTLR